MSKAKNPGIYIITHSPSGFVYVGQSNHISNRILEHKNQLKLGTHVNFKLQKLWNDNQENDFLFETVERPPDDLSPLELQRWLVKSERNHINIARKAGLSLNINDADIVKTKSAWEEHVRLKIQESKDEEKRSKERDKAIRESRKAINTDLKAFKDQVNSLVSEKFKLNQQLANLKRELKKENNWKAVLFGAPENIDFSGLKRTKPVTEEKIREIEKTMAQIEVKQSSLLKEKRKLLTRKESIRRLRKELPIPLAIDESFRPRIGKIEE